MGKKPRRPCPGPADPGGGGRLRVISLGWGIQSFALAAMSALGFLPRVDLALYVDTGWEPRSTRAFACMWTSWLEDRGIRVVTIRVPGNLVERGAVLIPAFCAYESGGLAGMLRRQCTAHWKVKPTLHWIRDNLSSRVELWLGITADESWRAAESRVQYVVNRFPFLELGWTRTYVVRWLYEHGLEIPPRSSCVCCPFRTHEEWIRIANDDEDRQAAIRADEMVRHAKPGYLCYLHRRRVPLSELFEYVQLSFS